MAHKCPSCLGENIRVEDSHWSYVSPNIREEIKYYKCTDCEEEFTNVITGV